MTIRAGALSFTLQDAQGDILYQQGAGGSLVTMRNAEHGCVRGMEDEILFEW